jgi:hypothetical protein
MDAKRVKTGVNSDHSAIKLKLRLKVSLKCKKKQKHKAPRKIVPDWDLLKQPENALGLQTEVGRLLTKTQRKDVKSFNNAIAKAGKATVPRCS